VSEQRLGKDVHCDGKLVVRCEYISVRKDSHVAYFGNNSGISLIVRLMHPIIQNLEVKIYFA